MSLKRLAKKGKKNAVLQEVDEVESVSSEEEETPKRQTQPKKKKGIKWTGIILLGMILLPVVAMCFLNIYDFLYPKEALLRRIREPIVKCYNVANPSKLNDIDYLMKKYEGNEIKLYAQLRSKYEKFEECQIFPRW